MDPPPLEDNIRELISNLDKTQLEKLWKLRTLTSLDEDQVQELQRLHDHYQLEGFIRIAKKVPSNIYSLIGDRLEEQPVDDYVTEFEIRWGIFTRIKLVACRSASSKINAALCASKLAALEKSYYHCKNQTEVDEMLAQWQITSLNGIQAFVNKGGSQKRASLAAPSIANSQPIVLHPAPTAQSPTSVDTGPSVPMPPNHARSSEAVKLCKRRDYDRCYFTGMPDPHAAHIFPSDVPENTTMITDMLEMFWDAETVTRLVPLVRDRNVTESPQNLISMNRQLHTWFDDCKMALKPLEETDEGVCVQFHWLHESTCEPDSVVLDFDTFTTQTGIRKNQSWGYMHAHRASGLSLDTGQTFVLRSENPDHMPNFELLKLSWDLSRVAAICGAAGEPWEPEDETCSSVSEENNYPDVLQWREEVEGGIEIETDVEMETEEDGQPGDDSEGPS
ncbi:hypothetical protein J3F84DRAFT_399715 [Trichoderma pleuroticola]